SMPPAEPIARGSRGSGAGQANGLIRWPLRARFSWSRSMMPSRSEKVGEADTVKHLGPEAIEDSEADVGAVFGRVVVDSEWSLAEWHVDRLDDEVRDRRRVGVVGDDVGESLHHLLAETVVGAGLIFCCARFVGRLSGIGEVIGTLGKGARHNDGRLD